MEIVQNGAALDRESNGDCLTLFLILRLNRHGFTLGDRIGEILVFLCSGAIGHRTAVCRLHGGEIVILLVVFDRLVILFLFFILLNHFLCRRKFFHHIGADGHCTQRTIGGEVQNRAFAARQGNGSHCVFAVIGGGTLCIPYII